MTLLHRKGDPRKNGCVQHDARLPSVMDLSMVESRGRMVEGREPENPISLLFLWLSTLDPQPSTFSYSPNCAATSVSEDPPSNVAPNTSSSSTSSRIPETFWCQNWLPAVVKPVSEP